MKTKQQLTRDYQYLFEISDQLLLAYKNDIFDEEIEDLTKCLPAEYFKRIELGKGGTVISISDYLKTKEPIKVKELDLAGMFTPGKTLSSLSSAEREAVNNLLKLTFGKKD